METLESSRAVGKSRVMLVEDHPIARHGLAMLIDDQPDLCVCGEAASVREAKEKFGSAKPDVVVVDLSLRDGNGLDLIQDLHDANPALPMLALSMHEETVYAERAMRAGAMGYVMKREVVDKVLTGIRRVLSGELFMSEKMTAVMVQKAISRPVTSMDALSEREFDVFRLLAQGVGPTEVAQKLQLSVKTVETHRGHIKEKLGLKNAAELTRFLGQWGSKNL